MKGALITHKGAEDIAAKEVKEMIKADSTIQDSIVLFETTAENICTLCYKSQSASTVLQLLFEFNVDKNLEKTVETIKKNLKPLNEYIDEKQTFMVACKRLGTHDFNSQDLAGNIGAEVKASLKNEISLRKPSLTFLIYIFEDKGYFGIDYAGIDLSKRDYNIFPNSKSIKATLAYAMLRISGYKKGEIIMDPFARSGTIPIEAALFSLNYPVNYYRKESLAFTNFKFLKIKKDFFEKIDAKILEEKKKMIHCLDSNMRNLRAAEKNAKIAGIQKAINFSRIAAEWLDAKYKEDAVDRIIANPPAPSKRIRESDIAKVYNELFYQAEYILRKTGKVVLIAKDLPLLEKYAKNHKCKLTEQRQIISGKETFPIAIFERA
ncbi:MAG: methyltransferase [bacterium]|nr:methyltransferase [bacterium]